MDVPSLESLPRPFPLWAAAIVQVGGAVLLLTLIFGGRLRGDFVWDDVDLVEKNRALYAPGGGVQLLITDLWRPVTGEVSSWYHPVPMLTLRFQAALTGRSLPAFRVGNLAIHGACGLLLFLLLARWGLASPAAVVASWIFLVHPSVTEVVMWLTGRHDSLGAAASLGALLVWSLGGPSSARVRAVLAGVLCALAFLSHERYVVTPALVVLADLLCHPEASGTPFRRRLAAWCLPFGFVLAGFALRTVLGIPSGSRLLAGPVFGHARAFAAILAHYASQLLLFRNGPTTETFRAATPAATFLILAVASFAAAWAVHSAARRRAALGPVALGLVWFLLGLLPLLLALPIFGMYGNRYAYFPWAGSVVALSFAAARLGALLPRGAGRVALAAALLFLAPLGLRTAAEAGNWHDAAALYGADLKRNPDDPHTVYHYGTAVRRRDGCEAALPYFGKATALDPAYRKAWHESANCLLELSRPEEAIPLCLREVAIEPRLASGFDHLGLAYLMAGRIEEAIQALNQSLALAPGQPKTIRLLEIARKRQAEAPAPLGP